MKPSLLDPHQIAEKLDTTYDEVLSWTRRGLIPAIKAGGRYYYNLAKVAKALHQNSLESADAPESTPEQEGDE